MALTKPTLLIVEDHQQLAANLFEYLGEDNYELDHAADGLTALHLLATQRYDLVVLDIMLPGINGLTLCQRIRNDLQSAVPIIMLTAKDAITDKEQAFTFGADDYLVKPFHMRELELRIESLIRKQQTTSDCIRAGELQFYPGTLTLNFGPHKQTKLSGYSATLFEALIKQYPNYVSHQTLSTLIWGNTDGDPHTIRTHVYSLRKKLKEDLGADLINTLHGRGYILNPPNVKA